MKNLLFLGIIFLTFLVSCSAPQDNTEMDAAELKNLINTKKTEQRAIEKEIDELTILLENKEGKKIELTTVTVDTAEVKNFEHFVNLQGTVISQDEVIASAEMGGRINRLFVTEGQNVSAGQIIARLDNQSLLSQKAEIETQLTLARDVFQRQEALWKDRIGSEVQFLESKTNVERLERNIETINTNLAKSTIYAPKSGVVSELNMKEGEFASPGIPIVSIVSNRNLKIVADMPESYLNTIRLGDKVSIEFPAINQTQQATISLIGSVINPANRTFKIEAKIQPDKNNLIKPNMLVKISINDYVLEDVIVLPLPLVQQEISGREYVMAVSKEGEHPTATKKYVKTGQSFNNRVVVEDGIKPGELVVRDGARGLVDGTLLSIITDSDADQLYESPSDSPNTATK